MVDYTTSVILSFKACEQAQRRLACAMPQPEMLRQYGFTVAQAAARLADLMEVLAAAGFVFTGGGDHIYGYSDKVEAAEVSSMLDDKGFDAGEYKLVVEYRRQWGVL